MPLEAAYLSVSERVEMLNSSYRHHAAVPVLTEALSDPLLGKIALVSSFGAESAVLLQMVAVIKPDTPVLMIDTEMLFPETLEYQSNLSNQLGLTDVRIIRATKEKLTGADPNNLLHKTNPDLCCFVRKTEPLKQALSEFDGWITGRKRFQSGRRAALDLFENESDVRIKINPLAHWRPQDVKDYIANNVLPHHPLVSQGYPSIGCAPCTSKVARNEDPRAGRWRGKGKSECGIHISADGTVQRNN